VSDPPVAITSFLVGSLGVENRLNCSVSFGLIRMRVLLPFGSTNKGSNSDTNNENCGSGDGVTSTVSSSSSRNNLQAFCTNGSERIEEAKLPEVDSTRASSGSCDRDSLSIVPIRSEAPPGGIDEETRKVRILFSY
jgi:hypothetical protein